MTLIEFLTSALVVGRKRKRQFEHDREAMKRIAECNTPTEKGERNE